MGNPLTYRGNTLTWDFGRRLASFGNISYTYNKDRIRPFNPFRYRGYYYDTDTNLYYLQSRYYDPETGRFLNSDDANFIGTTESEISYNPFAYCENDPVNAIDPTGRSTLSIIIGIASIIVTVAGIFATRFLWLVNAINAALAIASFIVTQRDYNRFVSTLRSWQKNYRTNLANAKMWLWIGRISAVLQLLCSLASIPVRWLSKTTLKYVINAVCSVRGTSLTLASLANDLASALLGVRVRFRKV